MSMDAGGLAQMTYNSSFSGSSLSVPHSGFASRGKASHIKRLSVPPSHISTIDESQPSIHVATPRTSRSHLLAGLRTAPKSATVPSASSAQHLHPNATQFVNQRQDERVPQTATGAGFPQHLRGLDTNPNLGSNTQHPMYTLPEQVLAPPAIDLHSDTPMDEKLYAELMSTNLFLVAQQQRLQQQLLSVTAAAQQFQNLNLRMSMTPQQQHQHQHQQQQQQQQQHSQLHNAGLPMHGMGFYQQQLQQGVQPVVQPVVGRPGLYSVYNPLTGQHSFVFDNSVQNEGSTSFYAEEDQAAALQVPTFKADVSPPREPSRLSTNAGPSVSPPSSSPSPPQEVVALPPPSANAFRRGHKKSSSLIPALKPSIDVSRMTSVGAGPKSAILPPTPMTGTFGPGQARAGEHPVRQPRGPPSLEDLVAKPTSKHEGSKNFATRQRRRAVHSLVRAGIERRGESRSLGYHSSSGGTNTPASETEFTFPDADDATVRSGASLSSKRSLGSLRAAANGAIGSERKERSSRERNSVDSSHASTPTSEDGSFSSKFGDSRSDRSSPSRVPSVAAVVAGRKTAAQSSERRKAPMLVLSSVEKRKTPLM